MGHTRALAWLLLALMVAVQCAAGAAPAQQPQQAADDDVETEWAGAEEAADVEVRRSGQNVLDVVRA
jgi:hypothetical protein